MLSSLIFSAREIDVDSLLLLRNEVKYLIYFLLAIMLHIILPRLL